VKALGLGHLVYRRVGLLEGVAHEGALELLSLGGSDLLGGGAAPDGLKGIENGRGDRVSVVTSSWKYTNAFGEGEALRRGRGSGDAHLAARGGGLDGGEGEKGGLGGHRRRWF